MRPLPIRYVHDVEAARRFYEALGLVVDFRSRPTRRGTTSWVELVGAGGGLALHLREPAAEHSAPGSTGVGPDPVVELSFEAQEPLEEVVARLSAAGYEPATAVVDEAFGRSFTVRDPEGLVLQVNEQDRRLQG